MSAWVRNDLLEKVKKLAYRYQIVGKSLKSQKYVLRVHEGHKVVMYDNKIYIPIKLLKKIINWYHHYLSHLIYICIYPRLLISEWLKQLHKVADCVFEIPPVVAHWPHQMLEPLKIGISPFHPQEALVIVDHP